MADPISPSTGWGVLHLFCKLPSPSEAGTIDTEELVRAAKDLTSADHQVVSFAVLGHKADVGFLVIGPDLWRLRDFQSSVQAAGLQVASSYVSLTEVSEYAKGMPAEMLDARLHPNLPPEGKRSICFYPMSKRRAAGQNWYALSYEERKEFMMGHGRAGKAFAGRVLQLVTGSTGLDDYEWGVTLFGVNPDDLKDAVYTMRFDEASAQFAEFGPFYTGLIGDLEAVLSRTSTVR